MRISVVVPVLNGARFLRQSLDSVVSQTRQPDEVIVVDGGSTDGSQAIATSYPNVRLIAQAGATGFAGGYDEGFAAATGDVVAPLDSDDWWAPEKSEIQLRVFETRPETAYVIGKTRHFLEAGHPIPPGLRPEILDQDRMAPMPGTLMIRRSAFQRVGAWGNGFTIAADIDWFARAKDILGPPAAVDQVVLFKR